MQGTIQSEEGAGIAKFKQFIIDNNIVGTSAGVCVALAAKDGIQSLVGDVIIPLIIMLLHALHIDSLSKFLPVNGRTQLNITDFVKQMVTFILIIIISFIFVQFAFSYLLGVNTIKENNKNSNAADIGLSADAIKTATATATSAGSKSGSGSGSGTDSGSGVIPKAGFGNFFDINESFQNW